MITQAKSPEMRGGFSLIELIVSMGILSIALAGLVPLTRRVASMSNESTVWTQRMAALSGEVMRVTAMPFDSLTPGYSCATSSGAAGYTACRRVTAINSTTRTVLVVVIPAGTPIRPDSVMVERSRPAAGNPLNLP